MAAQRIRLTAGAKYRIRMVGSCNRDAGWSSWFNTCEQDCETVGRLDEKGRWIIRRPDAPAYTGLVAAKWVTVI